MVATTKGVVLRFVPPSINYSRTVVALFSNMVSFLPVLTISWTARKRRRFQPSAPATKCRNERERKRRLAKYRQKKKQFELSNTIDATLDIEFDLLFAFAEMRENNETRLTMNESLGRSDETRDWRFAHVREGKKCRSVDVVIRA